MRSLVWAVLRRHRRALLAGAVLMLVGRTCVFVVPAIAKFVYDDVISGRRPELLLPLAGATLLAILIAALMAWLLTVVVSGAAEETVMRLRTEVQRHVLRLPLGHLEADRVGALVARIMTDPSGVSSLVGTGVIQLAGGALTVIVGSAVLLYLDWRLTVGTLLLLAAFASFTAVGVLRLRRIHGSIAALFADVSGRLSETLSGIPAVRAAGIESREQRTFAGGVERLQRQTTRSLAHAALLTAAAGITAGGISVLLMIVGGQAVLRGDMTPGELLWFAMTMGVVARPLASLAATSTQITHAIAGLDRVASILALPVAEPERRDAVRLPVATGTVVFDDVTFGYEDTVPLLRNLSFRAEPGSLNVIVGTSGAGKTTLLHLLLALRRPAAGRILIDGLPLSDIDLSDYRRQLGFVLQDGFLLHATIGDNIGCTIDRPTRAQVERAAAAAGAHEFIDALPYGYDTVIGERGVRLSAGQRQRIALARALVGRPRILILDEPTSSLDGDTEAAVLRSLLSSRERPTTFIVTHRTDALRAADQILILRDGRITSSTPREFMSSAAEARATPAARGGPERETDERTSGVDVPGRRPAPHPG